MNAELVRASARSTGQLPLLGVELVAIHRIETP